MSYAHCEQRRYQTHEMKKQIDVCCVWQGHLRLVDYVGNKQENLSEPNILIIIPIKLDLLIFICFFFFFLKPKYSISKPQGLSEINTFIVSPIKLDLLIFIFIRYFFFIFKPKHSVSKPGKKRLATPSCPILFYFLLSHKILISK